VRNSRRPERAASAADVVADRPSGLLQRLGWSHRDAVAFVVGLVASGWILVNMLFLQAGSHPAPMIKSSVVAPVPAPSLAPTNTVAPAPPEPPAKAAQPKVPSAPPSPVSTTATVPAPTPARVNAAVVMDIQRELTRRGFYDGAVDGKYGPRTDAAIREFEQEAGLRPSTEPNEALLRAIKASHVKPRPAARQQPAAVRADPIGELLAPSKQVLAVQRALSEFGYGQIKPTGIIDPDTQSAIQKFERERNLPVTGQLSHRVVRELASITGRPLE
jgi:peptidoglycan hydrolase-like protein with peptidoglycan-binding domain